MEEHDGKNFNRTKMNKSFFTYLVSFLTKSGRLLATFACFLLIRLPWLRPGSGARPFLLSAASGSGGSSGFGVSGPGVDPVFLASHRSAERASSIFSPFSFGRTLSR